MSFAVPGAPIVPGPQAVAQLPAAKRIVRSGCDHTNWSTIRAVTSYVFAVPRPPLQLGSGPTVPMSCRYNWAPRAPPSFGEVPRPVAFPARVEATAVPWPKVQSGAGGRWLLSLIDQGSQRPPPPGHAI